MTYALHLTGPGKNYYCYMQRGILHQTAKPLADEYPHLVRTWKTETAAKAVRTRVFNAYADGQVLTDLDSISVVQFPQ